MKCKMKIISFVLVMILLVSACIIPASAYHYGQNAFNTKYAKEFLFAYGYTEEDFPYLKEAHMTFYENVYQYNSDGNQVTDESTPDFILSFFNDGLGSWVGCADIIGDYIVTSDNIINNPYGIGLYIFSLKDNTIYTLKEAWNAQLPNIEWVLDYVGDRIGDVDYDDVLTIKDATAIQKHLAEVEILRYDIHMDEDGNGYVYRSDFDRDGERTIKDATAIQKYVAGLEY